MTTRFPAHAERQMAALEGWMAPFFAKAPHLPESARQSLAAVAPWLALVFGILGLLGIWSAGMIGSMMSYWFFGFGLMQVSMLVGLVAGFLAAVLEILAYAPLTRREKKGWNYLFYGSVLTLAAAVLDMVFGYGSGMLGSVVGSLIGFWLLFEVRALYK